MVPVLGRLPILTGLNSRNSCHSLDLLWEIWEWELAVDRAEDKQRQAVQHQQEKLRLRPLRMKHLKRRLTMILS